MSIEELSDAFDTEMSAYLKTTEFGESYGKLELDEYEKSVFLTQAQDMYVDALYTGKNQANDRFEITEEIRRKISPLVKTASLELNTTLKNASLNPVSHIFTLPADLRYIIYEKLVKKSAEGDCGTEPIVAEVVPTTHDDLSRILKNPFKQANKRRALRLDISGGVVEVVYPFEIETFTIRYVKNPAPIVLENLKTPLNIHGVSAVSQCELPESCLWEILQNAVRLAYTSKVNAMSMAK